MNPYYESVSFCRLSAYTCDYICVYIYIIRKLAVRPQFGAKMLFIINDKGKKQRQVDSLVFKMVINSKLILRISRMVSI